MEYDKPTYKEFRELMNKYPEHYVLCEKYAWEKYGRVSLPLRIETMEKDIESALARSFVQDGPFLKKTFHFEFVDPYTKKIVVASGSIVIHIETKKVLDLHDPEDVLLYAKGIEE